MSHGSRSGKWLSPRPAHSRPRALAPVERTSGIGSCRADLSSGRRRGRYGTMSFESARREHAALGRDREGARHIRVGSAILGLACQP
eukprot:635953-Prymnesium_polylepis.1